MCEQTPNMIDLISTYLTNCITAGERDNFMAEAVASSAGVNLVGVVGMAHMGGIERYLTDKKGFSVVMRNCPVAK